MDVSKWSGWPQAVRRLRAVGQAILSEPPDSLLQLSDLRRNFGPLSHSRLKVRNHTYPIIFLRISNAKVPAQYLMGSGQLICVPSTLSLIPTRISWTEIFKRPWERAWSYWWLCLLVSSFLPRRTALLCLWMFTLAMWLLVAYQFYGFPVEALHHCHHIPFPRRQWLCSVYQTGGSDMNVWITVVGRIPRWAGLTWAMSENNAFVVISHWDFIQPQYNLNILTNTGKVYLDLPFRFIFHPRGWL